MTHFHTSLRDWNRGWCPKFATGLNMIIGCSSKIYEWPDCCQNDSPIRGSFCHKDNLITHILFELQLIMIFSPVAILGHHPLHSFFWIWSLSSRSKKLGTLLHYCLYKGDEMHSSIYVQFNGDLYFHILLPVISVVIFSYFFNKQNCWTEITQRKSFFEYDDFRPKISLLKNKYAKEKSRTFSSFSSSSTLFYQSWILFVYLLFEYFF